MRRNVWLVAMLTGLASMTLPAGMAQADHVQVRIYTNSPQPPAPPATLYTTAPAVVVATPAVAPQPALQVRDITADRVQAQTIYANTIRADDIQGPVYQNDGLKIGAQQGTINAPDVVASVIYADTITANTVQAAAVYVRHRELPEYSYEIRGIQTP